MKLFHSKILPAISKGPCHYTSYKPVKPRFLSL